MISRSLAPESFVVYAQEKQSSNRSDTRQSLGQELPPVRAWEWRTITQRLLGRAPGATEEGGLPALASYTNQLNHHEISYLRESS